MPERNAVSAVSSPDRRRAIVAATAAASLFTHVAVLAAAVHFGGAAEIFELPQVAVAVEIVATSPDPGGEDHAAADGTAAAEDAYGVRAQDDAAADARAETDRETTPQPVDGMRTAAEAEAADADGVAMPEAEAEAESQAEAEAEAEAVALAPPPDMSVGVAENIAPNPFVAPTRRPVLEPAQHRPRAPERAVPPPRVAEQQAMAEQEQQPDPQSEREEGSDASPDGAATTDMVAHAGGKGDGSAGAVPGPRFRAGAPGNPLPAYPEAARRWGYEGRVVVAVRVSAAGEPLAVDVGESSGHSVLDQAAVRSIRRWRFQPAPETGAGTTMVTVPITFRLED